MLSTPYHRPWCAAAPWDPRVYTLLTALSMQHCVLPTQCGASYRLYYALSKRGGIRGYQHSSSRIRPLVRGTGHVLVLYGLNVVLAALMDPLLLLLCVRTRVFVFVWAIVRFIVNSRGIRGRFHLSTLIIGGSDSVNPLCPGNSHSEEQQYGACCGSAALVALNTTARLIQMMYVRLEMNFKPYGKCCCCLPNHTRLLSSRAGLISPC